MKTVFALLGVSLGMSSAAFAVQETCYQVSADGRAWSRTPESLCVLETGENRYALTLKAGLPFAEQEIARFSLNLLQRARCGDCNSDVYGVANPSNSTFNTLAVRFNGKVQIGPADGRVESGTVSIGNTTLHYRSFLR